MAGKAVAPKDALPALAAAKQLLADVQSLDAKALGGAAAAGAPRAKVGANSPSLGVDCSWYPAVPLGHTAYSWGADDEEGDVKLGNVWGAKQEHHYVSKAHDEKHAEHHAAAQPAAAAAPGTAAAAPAAAAEGAKKEGKKGDDKKKGGGDNSKAKDNKSADNKKSDAKKDDKKKGGAHKAEAPKPTAAAGTSAVFARLDIRAGKILKAWKHPKADKLYVEEIDVGEPKPRTIVSGLVEHIPVEQFTGSTVMVVCNLKPADMRGQMSYGMVLAASNDNRKTVELVHPADTAKPGERAFLKGGAAGTADAEVDLFVAGNAWIDAKDFLTTDANCFAMYNGTPIVTASGPAKAKSKSNGKIS